MLRNSGSNNIHEYLGRVLAERPKESCAMKQRKEHRKNRLGCKDVEYVQDMVYGMRRATGADKDLKKLHEMRKGSSCHPHSCLPTKKVRAKRAITVNGEQLDHTMIGLKIAPGGQGTATIENINNQTGYVYQEKTIVDKDRYIEALRNNNVLEHNVVTKLAEYDYHLYGVPFHAIDGQPTGDVDINKCERKARPCPPPFKCKKADPITNPIIGIGSDALENRSNLKEQIESGYAIQAIRATENEKKRLEAVLAGKLKEVEKAEDFQEGREAPVEAPPPVTGRPPKAELAQMEQKDFGFVLNAQERQQLDRPRISKVPKSMINKGYEGTIQEARAIRDSHRVQESRRERGGIFSQKVRRESEEL